MSRRDFKEIPDDVKDVLRAAQCTDNRARLDGQLDRKLYTRTNEVLEAFGARWNRREKAHVFPVGVSARKTIDQCLDSSTYEDEHSNGFFETSPSFALELAKRMKFPSTFDGHILEPSAGTGTLVAAAIAVYPRCHVTAVESHPKRCERLRQRMMELAAKRASPGLWGVAAEEDFLKAAPGLSTVDGVLMNPPFDEEYNHVMTAYDRLHHGGKFRPVLVSVMSNAVTFKTDRATRLFKEWLDSLEAVTSIEPNPEGTFKSSGTMVQTVTLTIRKG